jgi:hypothetical protein
LAIDPTIPQPPRRVPSVAEAPVVGVVEHGRIDPLERRRARYPTQHGDLGVDLHERGDQRSPLPLERYDLLACPKILGAPSLSCARAARLPKALLPVSTEIEVSERPVAAARLAEALHASILLQRECGEGECGEGRNG